MIYLLVIVFIILCPFHHIHHDTEILLFRNHTNGVKLKPHKWSDTQFYADDIVLMARCSSDLDKQLRLLKDFCSNMGMTVNTHKTKVMIIKSKKDTYTNFVYDNKNLES